MGQPDLIDDPRFARLVDRAERSDEINNLVADWTRSLSAADVETACVAHDVPVATAYTAVDIFDDPHIAARGDLVTVDDPVIGGVRQQAPFPRFVGTPVEAPSGAPRLGEHTREVLSSLLDMSVADLDRLAAEGVT
jgi:crotonobetainyl-CoA:carnitine CoA-transferase CaiB-like acyl-CoA transferase